MSSSVAVDDFPLALGASLFLADGRVSRLIFVGVGVSTTACLGSICSEPATFDDVLLLFHHLQFRR